MIKIVDNLKDANIITHAGSFHADEVLSTALMSELLPNINLIRVNEYPKNTNLFSYDIGLGKYDHHSDKPKKRANGIIYSSFGLLWQDYGKAYLEKLKISNIEDTFLYLDQNLVMQIDAVDNGFFPLEGNYPYYLLEEAITMYNPTWCEDTNSNEAFKEACIMADTILKREAKIASDKLKARKIVEDKINNCSNHILILDKYLPFREFILSSKNPKAQDILFVIYPSNRGGFNIKAVDKGLNNHELKKRFPELWGGKDKTFLQEITNIKTFTFCHKSGFLSSCETLEDAIKVAELALLN